MNGSCRRYLIASWSLLSVLAICVGGEAPLFPLQSTVVLLAGLPGDVESEKAYRDQLQSWLELLESTPGGYEKVAVFSDSPELVKLPAQLPSQSLKSGREEFLALVKSL